MARLCCARSRGRSGPGKACARRSTRAKRTPHRAAARPVDTKSDGRERLRTFAPLTRGAERTGFASPWSEAARAGRLPAVKLRPSGRGCSPRTGSKRCSLHDEEGSTGECLARKFGRSSLTTLGRLHGRARHAWRAALRGEWKAIGRSTETGGASRGGHALCALRCSDRGNWNASERSAAQQFELERPRIVEVTAAELEQLRAKAAWWRKERYEQFSRWWWTPARHGPRRVARAACAGDQRV